MPIDINVGEDWTDSVKDFNTTGSADVGPLTVTGDADVSGTITGATLMQGVNQALDASDLVPAIIVNESEIVNISPSAPPSTFAGKFWFDTANNLLKIRNEADDGWLDIWDTANDKPIITNLSLEIITSMLANDSVDKDKINADVAGLGLVQNVDGSLEINPDGSTVELSADILQVKDLGITLAKLNADVAGRLIDVQVFTVDGTWTKPAGCTNAEVWVIGGGGGGGYAATVNCIGGGGTGGGGVYEHITTGLGVTEAVAVGGAGVGGIASTATGATSGGASSFGSHNSAAGGLATYSNIYLAVIAGQGGLGSGGDINLRGGDSGASFLDLAGGVGKAANGGHSPFGYGVGGEGNTTATNASGRDAVGYGGGGSGAITIDGTDVDGGAGSAGIVIVKSYS